MHSSTGQFSRLNQDHDSNAFTCPMLILNHTEDGILGEPYFFRFIAGQGVQSEDDYTNGTIDNIILSNRSLTGRMDYCLLELG